MVTYKEFEILNYLTRFQGNTNGDHPGSAAKEGLFG